MTPEQLAAQRSVRCPKCKAKRGIACRTSARWRLYGVHPQRVESLRAFKSQKKRRQPRMYLPGDEGGIDWGTG